MTQTKTLTPPRPKAICCFICTISFVFCSTSLCKCSSFSNIIAFVTDEFFFKNGSNFVETRHTSHGSARKTFQMSAVLDLSASDTIEVYKFQDGGSARDVDGDSNRSTYFMGYKIA